MNFKTVLPIFFLTFVVTSSLYAADQTLTSYYPSPQGNYKNLTSQNMTVSQAVGQAGAALTISQNSGQTAAAINSTGALYVGENTGCPVLSTASQGAYIAWNLVCGSGATYLINNQGGGSGGFVFENTPAAGAPVSALMTISGAGHVGIGISPTAILHVSGADGNAASGTPIFKLSDTNLAGTYFAVDNGVGANDYRLITAGTSLELQTGGYSNQLVLNSNGNVGVNASSPSYKLDVNGIVAIENAGANAANYFGGGSTLCFTSGGACINAWNTPSIVESWGLNLVGNSASHQPVRVVGGALEVEPSNVYPMGGTDTTPAGDLLVSGSVGIGNTSPTLAGLQVDTLVGSTVAMFGTGTPGISLVENWPGVYFNSYWSGGWKFMGSGYAGILNFDPTTGAMYIELGNSGSAGGAVTYSSEPIYAKNNGNVGINNTNPSYTLDISGNVHATGTITADSDMRFKENIIPLTNVLPKIDRLKGVSFEWNHLAATRGHKEGEKSLGLIAQQLKKVYPELVQVDDTKHHYLSIDYEKFTAVLLESVKELKGRQDAMQQEINDLKNQVKALEKKK